MRALLYIASIFILAGVVIATSPNPGPTYQQVIRVTYTTNFWNVTNWTYINITNRYNVTNVIVLTNAPVFTISNLNVTSAIIKSWRTN
jgi:hypothetical protein